jgi:hypothetical protein
MKTARSCRPVVEGLEPIALLSAGGTGPASAIVSANRQRSAHHHLVGSVSGTWTPQPSIPDTGAIQDLVGNGNLKGLGIVSVQGSLHMPGFILSGHAEGTLTLTNRHGSVTLELTGPTQPGFSGPPGSFAYTITSGTGRYHGRQDSGQLTFQETAATTFTMRFAPA